MFVLGKVLFALLFPPGFFILALGLMSLLAARGRSAGRVLQETATDSGAAARGAAAAAGRHLARAAAPLGALAALLLYLLSTETFAGLLIAPLEDAEPPLAAAPGAELIVVLGGGSVRGSPEYGGRAALSDSGLRRAAYGAELHRRLGLPLLYSGGAPLEGAGAESEASAAGRFWEGIGIPRGDFLLEEESRDTAENASLGAAMLEGKGAILVTSAYHMPRSLLAFRRAGLEVTPAPTDYRRDRGGASLLDFLPSARALETSALALHEYVGLAWYAIRLPRPPR